MKTVCSNSEVQPHSAQTSIQEYVRQECPFEAVQNRLSIYLLHDRTRSWMMPLQSRRKVTLLSETPLYTYHNSVSTNC